MNALASALVKAQAAMPAVQDNARANYGTYVTLDHLIAKTRSVLNDHGLAIVQFPAVSELGAPVLRTILLHGESGESLEADCPLFLNGKQDMQTLGGAITYARRYGWGAALGISTDQDDDGNQVSAPAEKPAAKVTPSPDAATAGGTAAPPAPSQADIDKAVALVEERGGDVPAFRAALETARGKEDFAKWLAFQVSHWEKQPKPFKVPDSAKEKAA